LYASILDDGQTWEALVAGKKMVAVVKQGKTFAGTRILPAGAESGILAGENLLS